MNVDRKIQVFSVAAIMSAVAVLGLLASPQVAFATTCSHTKTSTCLGNGACVNFSQQLKLTVCQNAQPGCTVTAEDCIPTGGCGSDAQFLCVYAT